MKLKNIKHVFFDLDHTLWDFDKNSALTFKRIFEIHNIEVDLNNFLNVYEPINLKYWKLYREERISKPDLRYNRLREAFDSVAYFPADEVIDILSISYIEHLTTINYLFEGTVDLLEYLKQNYQLHIITNGFSEAQERKLINSNILDYFQTVTNSEQVGVKKPNPRIFNFAMQVASAAPDESIMIGDNIEADVEGAENVGMNSVWFDYKNSNKDYTKLRISKLNELKNWL
ncbi:YjjG family noncanonical pyrimidine nucleotidase [Winogradskyella aurantiaca]|uniref:YjjG family noncanonical pyrimidine nucleotidase n=1 Tax=Winogradskyella aurantiaca TaxID=2219558 RepID=UPI000E1C91A4|nr:YjjG family noncanonical pyrimidine nucleotidase [Winogradskyella aurantiaca]